MEELKKIQSPSIFSSRKNFKQVLDHANEEMYKRNLELAETNKALSLLRDIDNIVLKPSVTLEEFSSEICDTIAKTTGFPFVGILSSSSEHITHLELLGWAINPPIEETDLSILKNIKVKAHQHWLEKVKRADFVQKRDLPVHKIGKVLGVSAPEAAEIAQKLPLKSLYVVKLTARQRIVGLMVIGFPAPIEQLGHSEQTLMDRLNEPVGVALDSKLLFEENQRVLYKLRRTNQKLKELDDSKDEFISMASHQLRTPLTSVKGYVSMVIEGDAGKVTDLQKDLLGQAFSSSQRMVYLIADLLNVSRLKTGKFVIDLGETYLPDVIQSEVNQLKDSASSKQLTLTYEKPKAFPKVMLDETKTRQVIMNFMDNAIYYTPSGGRIDVSLTKDKKHIYFMVKDNGLGIPKAEQSHMFTKFYRATNARKARPDGTGLGLFMAKKVIAAQGGTVLFESEEGKGSTFGFCFDISKLKARKKTKKAR